MMKKILFFSAMCLTLAVCAAWISPNCNTNATADGDKPEAFVDMGLPSGTMWKATNEFGLYDYEAATARFEGNMPTARQFMELWRFCKWVWTSDGYRVTGPNGNSIFLPIAGKRDCEGNVKNANMEGYYWSITPNGDGVERLFIAEGHVGVSKEAKCSAVCVRLVQKAK